MRNIYKVGEHCFSLTTDSAMVSEFLDRMDNYKPFLCESDEIQPSVFELHIGIKTESSSHFDKITRIAEFDDDIAYISVNTDSCNNSIFCIALNKSLSVHGGILAIENAGKSARLSLSGDAEVCHQHFIINNAIMLLYAMFTSTLGTLLIHASVIENDKKGYAFLGRSGTGKSTHTRLWLNHIDKSELLNDDNPVVRVFSDGRAMIYGSPWSGKSPFYKNKGIVLKSIVRLSQAPYNRITKLSGVMAYAAISPSASSMKWDKKIADGLHKTFSELINIAGIYHLECLPDRDAAILSYNTVK